MYKIQVFYHTRLISGFPCVTLYRNSEVTVKRCYMIIAFGVELVKLGNKWQQLYYHSTSKFLGSLQYFQKNKFNLTNLVIIKRCSKVKKMKLLLQFVRYIEACVASPDWLDKSHSFFFSQFSFWVDWLFCENNQKWPKTKHCFHTFDTSDTFDSSDLTNIRKRRGQKTFTGENTSCTIKLIEFCNIPFLMRSFKDKII